MKLDRLQHEASPELYYSAPAPPQHISQPMPQPWNYTPEAELPDQIDAAAGVQHGMAYGAPADAGTLLRSSSYTSFGSEHGMQMDYSSDSDGNIYASAAIPLTADPSALHDGRLVTYRSGSETGYDVKEERRSPELGGYSRPGSSSSHHSVQPLVFRPQMMQVMHTDDAASKETQFLRRKCHNCHTTEPPSWRRSTLTPGKIVCNKCGLYERTHGRTRPHRFDELRCGTKVRKTTKIVSVISRETSPNTAARFRAMAAVKGEDAFPRRASTLESEASDASRSVSRNGSAYNSPNPGHAYPSDSPIRVPQAPMKSATLPMPAPYDPSARPLSSSADYYAYQRRSSLPNFGMPADRTDSGLSTPDGRRHSAAVGMPGIPEATGWQTIPVSELTASPSRKRN
ncbi:hypothetical protein CALCODRAFT_142315 [Calocera cornea HHB12733]|uniref:GATA-type domain-containing protein n=1 Tax=Calocera cornea HHB12733 TaxID=1353952 RepID=A0A165I5H6_9BASI|nr:hypothetical protein CALCODRAFT_142315 [Calocera cornea HHB12733]